MATFSERIGGVLISPMTRLKAAADEGRGATDVAILLALKLVAGETPRLAQAVSRGIELGLWSGVIALVSACGQVLPDLLAILVAGMLLSALSPAQTGGRDRALDLAAYAWIPYLSVELVGALYYTALREPPSQTMQTVLLAVGVAWSLAVWLCALVVLRRRREAAA